MLSSKPLVTRGRITANANYLGPCFLKDFIRITESTRFFCTNGTGIPRIEEQNDRRSPKEVFEEATEEPEERTADRMI